MQHPDKTVFESRAKLMVSGEYLVLTGALALALPLKHGQKLTVEPSEGEPAIRWTSMINNRIWFYTTLQLPDFRISDSNFPVLSETLRRVLIAAGTLNPDFLKMAESYLVTSEMDFDPSWGIGSSSSFISNIAWWADCDPFALNRQIFNGSGYDIACARSHSPIIYKTTGDKPLFRSARFHPSFHNQLYFVYLNRKQNSGESIQASDLTALSSKDIDTVSELTLNMETAGNLEEFQRLMLEHEKFIGQTLHKTPIGTEQFNDFAGSVKSLGAWGGDFILAASGASEKYIRNYFNNKNLTTICNYSEMVLR